MIGVNEMSVLDRLVCEGDEVELLTAMDRLDCQLAELGAVKLIALGIRFAQALQKPIEQITVADLFDGKGRVTPKVKA